MDIKEEDPLSAKIASQNETEFFTKIDTNSDAVHLDEHCDMAIKTEIKSETPFTELCSQKETECFTKCPIKQIKIEIIASSNNCEIHTKKETEKQTMVSDFDSLNKREFLPEDPAMKVKECNNDQEMDNKIDIKGEPWWLETETPSVYNDIKEWDFPAIKPSRLWKEAVSGDNNCKSLVSSSEVSETVTDFYIRKYYPECAGHEGGVTDIPVVEHIHSEQSGKNGDGEICSRAVCSKPKNLNLKDKRSCMCQIYNGSFSDLSSFKRHNMIHEGNKSHQCKMCDRCFTELSGLKRYNLIHEGKKLHQCKTCDKSFTRLTNLKTHYLIHEGKKPHQCKTCDKSFSRLSDLKRHNLIHEGKKPHQCKTCDKSFTQMSDLKQHNWIHEGKRPYQCKICDKRFNRLSNMKTHNLIHEGKKPHQCKTCDKSFTHLSNLKTHNLIHEGKRPHTCKTCGKSFTLLSDLKTHNLIHEGKRPHKCKTCDKSFTHISNLKRHNLIHEGEKPHQL